MLTHCTASLQSTIFPSFFRAPPSGVSYWRECLRMSDGGHVTLDWPLCNRGTRAAPHLSEDSPVLLLLSGIAGGSADTYVQHMVSDATAAGFRPVCFNSRGCAGGPVTVPQFYSASWTGDLREIVPLLRARYPRAPFFACGWSLGANILVNYLGEEGAAGRTKLLDGAVSMCNPFDLVTCDAALESTAMGRAYSRSMGAGLRRIFTPHAALFAGLEHVDAPGTAAAQTVREFDECMTRRTFGFESVDAYYRASGSKHRLRSVNIPLLCIQAADDPIAVDEAVPRDDIAANPHVALVVTPSGGHLGWIAAPGNPFGSPWPYEGALQWLHARAAELRATRGTIEDLAPPVEEAVVEKLTGARA